MLITSSDCKEGLDTFHQMTLQSQEHSDSLPSGHMDCNINSISDCVPVRSACKGQDLFRADSRATASASQARLRQHETVFNFPSGKNPQQLFHKK